jgi:glycerophosphoryl diester phosphodiesterase
VTRFQAIALGLLALAIAVLVFWQSHAAQGALAQNAGERSVGKAQYPRLPVSNDRVLPILAPYFDCLRKGNQTLVSAHRAGPATGLPENAIEAMLATLKRNPHALLEIDVQKSSDGVLFLLHDDRLDRTTTGTGAAMEQRWKALAKLRLEDNDGTPTRYRIPKLADALDQAIKRNAIVQLDVKRGVPFADVVAAVRRAKAQRHALIITYNDKDAAEVSVLAPELMVSVEITNPDMLARLSVKGVPTEQMLAWTGTREPKPDLIRDLRAFGIEPMFGTLGRPGRRLDDIWLADGNASEFADLAKTGVVVIGTDRAAEVERALPAVTCRK